MFKNLSLTAAEEKLASLIWREAPMTSPELVAFAAAEMDWKKSTTYTVLKKLCDKGVFRNENANISVLLTRDKLMSRQSRGFVEDAFGGSLPRFIAAFMGGKKLTGEQTAELKRLIEEHESTAHKNEGGENSIG
jgi:predicted transcriptional regulator